MKVKGEIMKKVSVIVPVYNMEGFIDKGVSCILKQTYQNLEIIMVDDGSTDNSLNMLLKAADRDNRVKVFTKPNEGAGLARNFGIERATGDFVYFFDIDDYMYPSCIEKLVNAQKEKNCDLVVCGFQIYDSKGITQTVVKADNYYRTGYEARIDYLDHCFMYGQYGIQGAAWYKLYKLSTINQRHITFPNLRRCEDNVFVARYVTYISSVYFIKDILCKHYVQHNEKNFERYSLNYFDNATLSKEYLLGTIFSWNKENLEVQNRIYTDYYKNTVISLCTLFSKKWQLDYNEIMEKITHISNVFCKEYKADKCNVNSPILNYLLNKNYNKLYFKIKHYYSRHKKD